MFALVAALQIAAPIFAPPVDRPISVTVDTVRSLSGATDKNFRSRRTVRFRRDGDGWIATLRIIESDGGATAAAQLFEAGFATLEGRDLIFRLDAAGRVTGVDDADALWTALTDAIAAVARSRNALAAQGIIDLMQRLPPERRVGQLASLLSPVIAIPEERVAHPQPKTILLPGSAAGGAAQTLTGTRTVAQDGDTLTVSVSAAGTGSRGARVAYRLKRRTSPLTGLVLDSEETIETRLPAPDNGASRAVTRIAIHY